MLQIYINILIDALKFNFINEEIERLLKFNKIELIMAFNENGEDSKTYRLKVNSEFEHTFEYIINSSDEHIIFKFDNIFQHVKKSELAAA